MDLLYLNALFNRFSPPLDPWTSADCPNWRTIIRAQHFTLKCNISHMNGVKFQRRPAGMTFWHGFPVTIKGQYLRD